MGFETMTLDELRLALIANPTNLELREAFGKRLKGTLDRIAGVVRDFSSLGLLKDSE